MKVTIRAPDRENGSRPYRMKDKKDRSVKSLSALLGYTRLETASKPDKKKKS